MSEPKDQIVVNPSAIPELGAAAVRYAAVLLSGWLIRRGIIGEADEPLIVGLLLAIASIGWAAYRVWANKVKLVTVARAAPDRVAIVTEPAPPPSAA